MAQNTLTTEQQQLEATVAASSDLVRAQLAALRLEQGRLRELLRVREADLQRLRLLTDELAYAASAGAEPGSPGARWVSRLEALQAKEQELRGGVEVLGSALNQLNALVSAYASITSPHELGRGADPLEAAVSGRMLQGQEAERSRLAREVHDGPAQVVANAIMALEYCERLAEKRPDAVPDELRRIKGTMNDGLEEVRRFIFDLRPSSLEYDGLRATLQRYAADYQGRFGVAVEVEADEVDPLLSPEQRFVAFRVVQESMQNARKHARATRLKVRLARLDGQLLVSVLDDGRGFDLEANRFRDGHFGLQGMRERAESVHGGIVVFSELGHGTEVRMTVRIVAQQSHRRQGLEGQRNLVGVRVPAAPSRRAQRL